MYQKYLLNNLSRLFLTSLFALASCGGGGGGGSSDPTEVPTQPASVVLDVIPKSIDTGDKFTVIAYVQDVVTDGIFLKIRVPVSVLYVSFSGTLEVNGQVSTIRPQFYQSDTTYNYLVYKLDPSLIPAGVEGKLSVQFQGSKAVSSGTIAVDADYNDPKINDALEFNVADPQFTAQDSVDVKVAG